MIKNLTLAFLGLFFFSGCQLGYYFSSAKNQLMLMNTRKSVDNVLKNYPLTEEQKNKLLLAQKARIYAFEKLKLKKTDNYSTYVELHRPYVSWVVNAAEKWEMRNYKWSYPIIGAMPYRGYFTEEEAHEEARQMESKGYDTYVRGVSAYSTLGWFQDSVLSSMLRYKEHDLVNTIIHEIVHTTIYIKNNSDFNERLAVFIGAKGTEMFYKDLEGEHSKTLELIKKENEDDALFAKFISEEIKQISQWYTEHQNDKNESEREKRLAQVVSNYAQKLRPQLKTNLYPKFEKEKMNNARLGLYKTYMENLDHFEELYQKLGKDLLKFIDTVKTLEKSEDPESDLKKL